MDNHTINLEKDDMRVTTFSSTQEIDECLEDINQTENNLALYEKLAKLLKEASERENEQYES